MAFPVGWTWRETHSVTTEPSSDLTDFTHVISANQFSSGFAAAVKTDGADIRVSTDSAGSTQVPCVPVGFSSNGTSCAGLILCKASVAAAGAPQFYIWCGNASASLDAATDPFGQHACFASHVKGYWPSGGGDDLTSNANHLTMSGSPTVGGSDGPINGSTATTLNGTSQYGLATASVPTAVPMTLCAWGRPNATNVGYYAISVEASAVALNQFGLSWNNSAAVLAVSRNSSAVFAVSSGTYSANTWAASDAVFTSSTSRNAYRNGGNSGSNTTSSTPASINQIAVGCTAMNSVAGSYFAGRLAFVSLHTTNLSSAWIAYRYNMLADADQSDFFGTWSGESVGGGAAKPWYYTAQQRVVS